jgi:hypothetical protein
MCILLLPHSWYMLCPSHPPWLDHTFGNIAAVK